MKYLFRYQAIEMDDKQDGHTSYGLLAERLEDDGWKSVAFVSDISCNREFVSNLAEKCSVGQLDPIHIYDVVIDAIS